MVVHSLGKGKVESSILSDGSEVVMEESLGKFEVFSEGLIPVTFAEFKAAPAGTLMQVIGVNNGDVFFSEKLSLLHVQRLAGENGEMTGRVDEGDIVPDYWEFLTAEKNALVGFLPKEGLVDTDQVIDRAHGDHVYYLFHPLVIGTADDSR